MNKITIFARNGYCRDLRRRHENKGGCQGGPMQGCLLVCNVDYDCIF